MNKEIDMSKEVLRRLLLESVSVGESQSGERHLASCSSDSNHSVAAFNPGDLPTVQTHYEALLKRRLRQEIVHRPPLFPWEKGVQDYPDILNTGSTRGSIWLDHLKNLEVPSDLPEEVLTELLNQCQQVAKHTLQMGRRLVQAVEVLFPAQSQSLDYIAGLVVRPAYRSAQTPTLEQVNYGTATPQQQIALSMLAAKSIFEALTLTVSSAQPTVNRIWLTKAGVVIVGAIYHSRSASQPQLEVRITLPAAGAVDIVDREECLRAERSTPGDLVLSINPVESRCPYTVELSLGEHPDDALQFQVMIAA
jgi:hypothetical protein